VLDTMSRAACHPTDEELTATFERLLASGGRDGLPSCTGLDSETLAAIQKAWELATAVANAAARHAFALQRNGTHIRDAEAREAAYFAAAHLGG
jgi:hypothetical protein